MATKFKVNNKQSNFAEMVISSIKSGLWCSNDRLLSERLLGEKFNLSRTTVRGSLKMLEELGVITRRGKFTYISENALNIIENLNDESKRRLLVVLNGDQIDNPIYKTIFNTVVGNLENAIQVRVMFMNNYPGSIDNIIADDDIVLFLGKRPEKQIRSVLKHTPNVILVNSCHPDCSYIIPDNYLGGKLMAEHLFMNGHTRIGAVFMGIRLEDEFSERFMGARNFLLEHNIALQELPEITRLEGENDVSLFQRAFLQMWETLHPTGIICQHDGIALPLYELLNAKGIRIPEDISIVGFDDQLYSSYAIPPLATVRYPTDAIGMEIISVIEHILSGETSLIRKKLDPRLFKRESVADISLK